MRTYDALYIAKKVVNSTNAEQGDSITNLKLQKLLYYLQGFWLAVFDAPLFTEEIEAWMYGPVVPKVYDAYKEYGKNGIPVDHLSNEQFPLDTDKEESLFYDVYTQYSQYSAVALMNMTHKEMPWASTDVGRGSVIPHKRMKRFFDTLVEDYEVE